MSSTANKLPSLSVFFPCYNEAENLPNLLNQALLVLPDLAKKFEIIVVDDGSADDTVAVVKKFSKQMPEVKLVCHSVNQGYGSAVRTGLKNAKLDWVFYTDGDGQFDLQELEAFVQEAHQGATAILGYRRQRAEGVKRALMARLYKFYIDLLFRVHVRDIDCAFKLFKTEVVSSLPLFSTGAFISSEILYRLKKKGVEFVQLPVHHYPRKYGSPTGASLRVIMIGLWEPLKLYLRLKFGRGLAGEKAGKKRKN